MLRRTIIIPNKNKPSYGMSVYNKANQGQHLRFPLNNSVNYGKETGCPMDLFWGNGSEPFDFY
jgi:hypothetical protein